MKRIYISLSTKGSLENGIKELEEYKIDITRKTKLLVERLIEEVGIKTAVENSGVYAGMILFQKEVTDSGDGVQGLLIATDGKKIIREWKYKGGLKQAVVSPLLMAEFGSGWLAKVLDNVDGVGQGTFPGEKHAFDKDGWWWTTPDGVKHHSYGEAPTYPVHSAFYAMLFEINRIAKEVFNGK